MTQAKAIRIFETGGPEVMQYVDVDVPAHGPGEATMTDLGFTGGGKDAGMMYVSGKPDHKVSNADMIDKIVAQVEARAAILRAARDTASQAAE
jgi:(E)-4-hydroxy-3-methylbut-2-enyl-diphosphate synthase